MDSKDKRTSESAIHNSPPKFVKLPTDSLVAEGEDVSFECAVIGEPKPEVKWYFDNNEIVADNRILVSSYFICLIQFNSFTNLLMNVIALFR